MPEKAALMSNLLQRVPRKFSSTSTVPIISSNSFTLAKCLLRCFEMAPSENDRASDSLVSSHTPGDCIVAPHATVHPNTRSSPNTSAICTSGRPFWKVTNTPSDAKKPFSIFTTSALCCCLVMRKMMSYVPLISLGVYATTGWFKFIVPTTCAPFSFKAVTWALLRLMSSIGTPALLMNAPRIVPNEPAP